MNHHEATALPRVAWRISSRSANGGGQCVEAGPVLDGSARFAVRDSKNRHDGALVFTARPWTAFLTALKRGNLAR